MLPAATAPSGLAALQPRQQALSTPRLGRSLEKRYNRSSFDMTDTVQKSRFDVWIHPTWWNMLVTLPLVIGSIFQIYWAASYRHVASRERNTQGVVTAHETSNHNQFRYVFPVDGQNYFGLDGARGADPKIGDHVIVHYDPKNPSTNALTDFTTLSSESLGPVPAMFILIGVIAWFIAHRRRQLKAPGSPSRQL